MLAKKQKNISSKFKNKTVVKLVKNEKQSLAKTIVNIQNNKKGKS